MKKLLTICLMLLGVIAQAQNFAITATTEAAIRKNIVKGNAANYGFGMINDTLKLVGLTTRNVIFTGSTSKTDIGLGNVDNTSDLNKPVSTATQTALNLKQNQLNGTGFVKATGTTISYDNSTYLSTSTAASTYLPISNPTSTGTLTAPTIANSLGANFAISSGFVGINTTTNQGYKLDVNGTLRTVNDAYFATTSGNVGIGTTTPAYKLDVNGTFKTTSTTDLAVGGGIVSMGAVSGTNTIGVEIGTSRTGTGTSYIDLAGESTNTDYGIRIMRDGLSSQILHSGTGNMNINSIGTGNLLFSTQNAERMRINQSGNVGIGTTSPNASSILDITSTTKGVLFPRMTTTEISAIASPADGLTVYNTTLKAICFYDAGAAVWKRVSHSNM